MRSASRPVLALALLAAARLAPGGELTASAVVAGRALAVESRVPWIDGAFGRLTEGGAAPGFEGMARAEAHLGLDWSPSPGRPRSGSTAPRARSRGPR